MAAAPRRRVEAAVRATARAVAAVTFGLALAGCNGLRTLDHLATREGYVHAGRSAYGPHARQYVEVYRPDPAPPAPAPVVVFFHGGRWSYGEPAQYRFVAAMLTARGYVAVLPAYRLYPHARLAEFSADAAAALAWTCAHAPGFGGDPGAVFVMGHSAGAHLAALVTLDHALRESAGACAPAGMIGLAGPYDFLPLTDPDLQDMFGPPERHAASQPVTYADRPAPPLLLVHGLRDTAVRARNTASLAARARAAGTPVTVGEYRWFGHGGILAALAPRLGWMSDVQQRIADFIARHAGRGAPA